MNKNVALLALTLLGCAGANEPRCASGNGYIYDSSTDGRSEVFNLKSMTMSTQSKSDADIKRSDSEFAGPIASCSSKLYLCVSGSLNISIPRGSTPNAWSFNGFKCKTMRASESADRVIIECAGGKRPASMKAEYSKSRGILSYRRQNVGDEAVFRARSGCGLFALK